MNILKKFLVAIEFFLTILVCCFVILFMVLRLTNSKQSRMRVMENAIGRLVKIIEE